MNTRTLIFDFNDLQNPILSSTYLGTSAAIDHNGYVLRNEYYMASYRAGLRVFDITNIANASSAMKEIAYFDTYPANNSTAFNGAWSVYPYFASGNIIINDIERGLLVVRKSGTLGLDTKKLKSNFSIFPNPAAEKTTITSTNNQIIRSIKIYSILGKKLMDIKNINQSKYVLETKNFQRGVYLVQINNMMMEKIVVQ